MLGIIKAAINNFETAIEDMNVQCNQDTAMNLNRIASLGAGIFRPAYNILSQVFDFAITGRAYNFEVEQSMSREGAVDRREVITDYNESSPQTWTRSVNQSCVI